MIHIDHLIKVFEGNQRAIDDISLQVEAGEIFGFLGPNGAGKTTTIKIMTTLLRPTSGTVTVAGHDVVTDPLAVRMSFGYIGQQSGVDPALTVSENLLLSGRLYHLSPKKIAAQMETLLELFDMKGREGQWVGSLSGGLKRRLDIATALIHAPKLLFLDEPTIGLDPKSRSDLWAYLRRLNSESGMTLFLTTHYLDEVDQLAHRVGILDDGRLRTIGTPDQLKDSLGEDTIHLTFDKPVQNTVLAVFRKKEWFSEVIQEGTALRLYLKDGQKRLLKVIQWLDELGLSAKSVLLARPSFDDVYLKYTGKNWLLAAEAAEDESGGWGGGKNNKWAKKWQKKGEPTGTEWSESAEWDKSAGDPEGDATEKPWEKWGDQAVSDWPAEKVKNKDAPDQAWPKDNSTAPTETETEHATEADPEWQKWGDQAHSDGSSDKPSGEDKNG